METEKAIASDAPALNNAPDKAPSNRGAADIKFIDFDGTPLRRILSIHALPFDPDEASLAQLDYVNNYVRHEDMACKSIAIEKPYIDRDYMEDHSVFYASSFCDYTNACRRVHFFKLDAAKVQQELLKLLSIIKGSTDEIYKNACEGFSHNAYLGFSVIRPLQGSPVGRTVLKCYGETSKSGDIRKFAGIRPYRAHLLGIELTVKGLAFQQQDTGVSACATTALWSAMQKLRDLEDIASITPAHITTIASRYALPFGRSMPSEGLSVDQMCQSIQAVGASPYLVRTDDLLTARSHLYSASMTGFPLVLVLRRGRFPKIECHAVAVAGMKVRKAHKQSIIGTAVKVRGRKVNFGMDDKSGDLKALYLHDDRNGPYVRSVLKENRKKPQLSMSFDFDNRPKETWDLTHIIIPLHPKIRVAFGALRDVALNSVLSAVDAYRVKRLKTRLSGDELVFETLIERGQKYIKDLCRDKNALPAERIQHFCKTIPLSRYIGIIRFSATDIGAIDFLIDSTSTPRNMNTLGILARVSVANATKGLVDRLSSKYKCAGIC